MIRFTRQCLMLNFPILIGPNFSSSLSFSSGLKTLLSAIFLSCQSLTYLHLQLSHNLVEASLPNFIRL